MIRLSGQRAARTTRRGRPLFFPLALALAALAICAGAARASGPAPHPGGGGAARGATPIALGAPGDRAIRLLACESGRELARAELSAPLSAPLSVSLSAPPGVAPSAPLSAPPGAGTVYAATADAALHALRLTDLAPVASARLAWAAHAVSASSGADGIVVAGADGASPLAAFDAATLEHLSDYPLEARARVSGLEHLPERGRFVVSFADRDEIWEIDYRRDAPPVLKGLVHDYRSNEALPLPGRLTARVFKVAGATAAIAPGGVAYEALRVDRAGGIGVLNLQVRREIERPLPELRMADPPPIAAWSGPGRRGWAIATARGRLTLLESLRWSATQVDLGGEIVSLARAGSAHELLALVRDGAQTAIVRIDALAARVSARERLDDAEGRARALVRSPQGACVAVIDGRGQWLGATDPRSLRAPGSPTPTSSPPPTR